MTTGANGQKACILRTDKKHDAISHHGAGKGLTDPAHNGNLSLAENNDGPEDTN